MGSDGEPGWLLVRTGRLGKPVAVPLDDAVQGADAVWVPFSRELIRSAPKLDTDRLDADAERRLREHYGLAESG